MGSPTIRGIAPFFLVHAASAAVAFYRDKLGFEVAFQEPDQDPFLAMLCRDGAMLMVKAVGVDPMPNATRHEWARWDAYVNVPNPDPLAAEFASRGVVFSMPLGDTEDGLRGFELRDNDGYVLFFGCPCERAS